jgi:hypothetical protein
MFRWWLYKNLSTPQNSCHLKLQTNRSSTMALQCCCCVFFYYIIIIINDCWFMQMQDISIPEMCYSPRPLARLISFCGVDKFLYSHHLNIDYILQLFSWREHMLVKKVAWDVCDWLLIIATTPKTTIAYTLSFTLNGCGSNHTSGINCYKVYLKAKLNSIHKSSIYIIFPSLFH